MTGIRAGLLILGWSLASFLARPLGIWLALGAAAVVLGAFSAVWGGKRLLGAGRHAAMVPLGALLGLVMAAATALLYGPVTRSSPTLSTEIVLLYEVFRSTGIIGALLLMPVVLICEELVWRGAVHDAVSRRYPPLTAVAIGTALYTLAHVPYGSPVIILAAAGAGSCWASLRSYSDSLPAVVAAHAVWNYGVLFLYQGTAGG